MMEIINGPLLLFLTVLCTLSALIPYFVKPILSCICRPCAEERTLWNELMRLKAEQRGISMKEEFAAYSRVQRKINKVELDLKSSSQTRASKNLALKSTLSLIFQGFVGFILVCSIFWYRYEPLVRFNADLSPIGLFLSYPTQLSNSISAHIWVIISNYSIRTLLKSMVS